MNFSKKLKGAFLIFSWCLYDLANQFFALNIVSLYFVQWLTIERKTPEIFYSISFAVSTLFVAALSPILGFVSDETQKRMPFLILLTLLCVIFTMLLGISKNIFLSLVFFAIANFGCQTAVVFYNALMVNIAPKDKIGLISGVGRMFSYSGAILALYFAKPVVLTKGYQAVFLPTGIFFLIFSLPCFLFIKDRPAEKKKVNFIDFFVNKNKIYAIFKNLQQLAFQKYNSVKLSDFFKATFFAMCGINAVMLFMSVYAKQVFGLDDAGLINLVSISTLFAIAGSLFSGLLSDFLGYKRLLGLTFILWMVGFFLGAKAQHAQSYWLIGALVGIALGSTWAVSRALAIELAPKGRAAEVFGLFNLVGYFSGIVGPLSWSLILLLLRPFGVLGYRIALLSLILFMCLGFIFLLRLPSDKKIRNG